MKRGEGRAIRHFDRFTFGVLVLPVFGSRNEHQERTVGRDGGLDLQRIVVIIVLSLLFALFFYYDFITFKSPCDLLLGGY